MAEALAWLFGTLFGLALLWGWDRQDALNNVAEDLKAYLGDVEVARDISESGIRVHYAAVAAQLKQIIRNHFKL